MKGPGGWALAGAASSDAPPLQDRAIAVPGGGYCVCESAPFCQGPASRDWATCAAPTCKPCRVPPPPRPVVSEDLSS
jgi:hypothetical protein